MSFDYLASEAEALQMKAARLYMKARSTDPPKHAQSYSDYDEDVHNQLGDIAALYEPFLNLPSPDYAVTDVTLMTNVTQLLSQGHASLDLSKEYVLANPDLTVIQDVGDGIARWTGYAADTFRKEFVRPFPAIATNQFIVAAVARLVVLAQQDIWTRARDDIDGILHRTDSALDTIDECGPNDWTYSFTVVASLACILATVASGGVAGVASTNLANAAAGVAGASTVLSVKPPMLQAMETDVSAETVPGVISRMRQAITALYLHIEEEERKILTALQKVVGDLDKNRSLFVSKRPALASTTRENATSDSYLGSYV